MKDSSDRGLGEGEGLENGLPQPFVESMRTLFDILDDQHTGRVKFSDIERRWHEDEDCGSSGLPAGVLDSLRVVTPLDGYLSFSRFCKGLQICLLRSKSGNLSLMPQMSSSNSSSLESTKSGRRSFGQARVHPKDDDVPPPLPPPPPPLRDTSPPPLPYHSHPNNNNNNHSKKSSTATNSYDHQKQQAISSSRQNPGSQQPPNNPRNPPWASQGGAGRSRQPLPPSQGTTNSITSSSNRASDAFKLDQFIQHASHRSALYSDAANSYQKTSLTDAAPDGAIIYQRSGSSEKPSRYDASASVDHYNNSNNINIAAAQSRVNQYINNGGGATKLPSPRKSSSSKSIRSSLSSEDILRDNSGDPTASSPSYVRGGGTHHHKTDIRMGTAGMMSLYGTKISSTTSSSHHGEQGHSTGTKSGSGVSGPTEGPPKPPRALESQNSDGNLNSGSERKVNSTNSNTGDGPSNHGVSSVAHRVDSLINKMEALSSTYGTAASSKNYTSNNVKQDKIYDRVSKSRTSSNGNSLSSAGKTLSGGNLLNGDRNLPPTSFSSHLPSSNSASASKFSSNSGVAPAGSHFSQGGSSFAPPPPVRGGGMGGRAPATLPLSALNGYSLQRSQTHSHITTHSLERDSRTDARRPQPETVPSKTRTRRGGSLERLLDGHQHHNSISNSNGVGGGLPALPSYSHYHPHYNHHHHSRESSNDTTSTAPAFPYHWNTDWNSATNGQQQRGQSNQLQQQQHVSYAAGPHGKHGYQMAGGTEPYGNNPNGSKNKGDDGQQQSSSNENSPRRPSTAVPSHAAAADHRLTMSSYAWIRGGDDSSGSDVNTNTDQHHRHHHLRHPTATGFTAPATAVTYAASSAHTATVTPTAALASASSAAASGSDVDAAGGGSGGGGVVMRGHRKGRRREPRRHTLQNGLDYAAVRRAGELEAERDMLHQGLQVVEQARQWYRSQLHRLLASLHNPSDPTQQPYDSEAQQQKLHYQLARITEINTQLSALMNASQMPHHLALATTTTAAPPGVAGGEGAEEDKVKMEGQVKRLRNQNQQLTEEVSQKSQHISALEQDKSRLLQELFQARAVSASMQAGGQADSTFM